MNLFDEAHAVVAWHSQVGQKDAIAILVEGFQCRLAVVRGVHLDVVDGFEQLTHVFADLLVVVRYQYSL